MRKIPLTKGLFALVDDDDYDELNKHKWHALRSGEHFTAARRTAKRPDNGKRDYVLMHRAVMNAPKDKVVDHINHNKLDNQKSNLRACTQSENLCNQISKVCRTGYKGVYLSRNRSRGINNTQKIRKKYYAMICVNKKKIRLGSFASKHNAALAYNLKALELHGEFAYLNDIKADNLSQ